MPARDGTGPQSLGPMTGRGMGFCVGAVPGADNTRGCGMGRGRGGRGAGGRGFRNIFHATGLTGRQRAAGAVPAAPATDADPLSDLKAQARRMATELNNLQQRIEQSDAETR